MKNKNLEQHTEGEFAALAGSASAVGVGEAVGYTTRTASLQMNGDKRAVLIEVGISDEKRKQVLLSKSLSAMAAAEWEVESMSEDDVSKYLERESKQYVVVTPNAGVQRSSTATEDSP